MAAVVDLCTDAAEWDAFVRASPHGSVFVTTAFMGCLGFAYDVYVLREDGRIIAGAPIYFNQGHVFASPLPFTLYQGLLLAGDICDRPPHSRIKRGLEIVEMLCAELVSRHELVSFCQHYSFEDLRAFQWFNYHKPESGLFTIDLRYTGLLELEQAGDYKKYLGQVRELRQREYRKATRSGFTVVESRDIGILIKLYQKTFDRQGMRIDPDEEGLVLRLVEGLIDKGIGEMLMCRAPGGEPVSATVFLRDWRSGYYLIGANDPEYRNSGSATLVMLENIRRCMQDKLKTVDFVGANSPNRGDYKMSFNAVPRPYFSVAWTRPQG